MARHVVGIDVGTSSARAGVFTVTGRMLSSKSVSITVHNPAADHFEQSSAEIWASVCAAVRSAITAAGVPSDTIIGVGFDATCSLVVHDAAGNPLSVSATGSGACAGPTALVPIMHRLMCVSLMCVLLAAGEPLRDIIMWLDHRAIAGV